MPLLLSIDPAAGKKQAYAVFSLDGTNRPLLSYGRCWLADLVPKIEDVDQVVCEGQYIGKRTYWASVLKLAHCTGRIWEMAESRGKPFSIVPPSAWQGLIRGPSCKTRKDLQERAIKQALLEIRVSGLTVPEKLNVDEAAAICIGVWAAGREEMRCKNNLS